LARFWLPAIGVLLVLLFTLILPDTFPTEVTVRGIINAGAIIALLSMAQMVVVIVGEFDLSVGYMVGLLHILTIGFITRTDIAWLAVILIVVLIGTSVGLVNGLLVYFLKVDSFIATLGTGTIAYAASNWYTEGQQVFGDLPTAFTGLYDSTPLGVPASALYVLGTALILWFVLTYTPTGRKLYALGSNRRAAELTGISSRRFVIGAFMASGFIVGCVGVLMASQLRLGSVTNGPDLLLPIFVGAILGSTTIRPGRPNAWGTVVAVYVLAIGIAGFQQLGAQFYITPLFNGVTLIVGVSIAAYASNRIRKAKPAIAPPSPPPPSPEETSQPDASDAAPSRSV
jgi:ribose transport system permease protein